jgi:predicted negative regulator of RcsB-dependent stress response
MSEHVYFLTIGLPLGTILLIFGMKYWSAAQQAKARLASDEAYRQVAAQAAAAQAETAATLASIDATLADLTTRLSAVEKMLREVE